MIQHTNDSAAAGDLILLNCEGCCTHIRGGAAEPVCSALLLSFGAIFTLFGPHNTHRVPPYPIVPRSTNDFKFWCPAMALALLGLVEASIASWLRWTSGSTGRALGRDQLSDGRTRDKQLYYLNSSGAAALNKRRNDDPLCG